jgi:hypothetical protein
MPKKNKCRNRTNAGGRAVPFTIRILGMPFTISVYHSQNVKKYFEFLLEKSLDSDGFRWISTS